MSAIGKVVTSIPSGKILEAEVQFSTEVLATGRKKDGHRVALRHAHRPSLVTPYFGNLDGQDRLFLRDFQAVNIQRATRAKVVANTDGQETIFRCLDGQVRIDVAVGVIVALDVLAIVGVVDVHHRVEVRT